MSDKSPDKPNPGCATATPLELKLLAAARAHAEGVPGAQMKALEILLAELRKTGQLVDPAVEKPLRALLDRLRTDYGGKPG